MHAWLSFLTGHAAFSLELEQSLRAVAADAPALPYVALLSRGFSRI